MLTHAVALQEFYGALPPSSGECRQVRLSRRGRKSNIVLLILVGN